MSGKRDSTRDSQLGRLVLYRLSYFAIYFIYNHLQLGKCLFISVVYLLVYLNVKSEMK